MTESSFLHQLWSGRLRWDLISPFPRPAPEDHRARGTGLAAFDTIKAGQDADTLVRELAKHGLTKATVPLHLGGLGLSPWATFRLVAVAASISLPAALTMAAANAFGLGALLPQLPRCPLRDLVEVWIKAGDVGALADTEPEGASNLARQTTASTVDGQTHVLNGEKLFVSNAPVADRLILSATVDGRRRLVVLDRAMPGIEVTAQEMAGLAGFPLGRVTCRKVAFGAERLVPEQSDPAARITPEAAKLVRTGKIYFTTAPCLAIARQLLAGAIAHVRARRIDGEPLARFDEIRRRLAESAADVYAIEALADWALLTPHAVTGAEAGLERSITKNAATALAWRVAERLVPLLAGHGYETPRSLRARGAQPLAAAASAFQDLLAFRIAGGVDFRVDHLYATSYILPLQQGDPVEASVPPDFPSPMRRHACYLQDRTRTFALLCRDLSARDLDLGQRGPILVNRLATELLTAAVVLAKATRPDESEPDMANMYCAGARPRIEGLCRRLTDDASPDYDRVLKRAEAMLALGTQGGIS